MKVNRNDKIKIGKEIKNQRLTLDKNQRSLRKVAAVCDMNFSTLNDIEHGDSFPTERVILKLANNLNFSKKKRISLLDKYAKVLGIAPPDIDIFLTTKTGKKLIPVLRILMQKELSDIETDRICDIAQNLKDSEQ